MIHTALASKALASVPAFGNEVAAVVSWLQGGQQPDGSWGGDPYPTALALQALQALAGVPFCGDGAVNQPGEACDGSVPAGLTCQGIGLGSGTLACSPQCTLDTSGCSAPPVCGDNLRNQPFEVCDGADLASQTCQTQGFATGTLACSLDCLSFNVVPPSVPHWPCPGDHWHYQVWNQGPPPACQNFLSSWYLGGCIPPPVPVPCPPV